MKLPDYSPRIVLDRVGRFLHCLCRDKRVRATPEEIVRQRVLHWLLRVKRLVTRSQVRLEDHAIDTSLRRGRADISIRDANGKIRLIVEVKRPKEAIGLAVERQAINYARRHGAAEVWLTNGRDHAFLQKRGVKWRSVMRLRSLRGIALRRNPPIRVPSLLNVRRSPPLLLKRLKLNGLRGERLDCALALQKLVHAPKEFFRLPFSNNGVHILEDRGLSEITFPTPHPTGGRWTSDYRVFLVATEGRVETAAVGINSWVPNKRILNKRILCVGFLKEDRRHHALQLQLASCRRRTDGAHDVWHHGMIGGRSISSQVVRQALSEAGRDDLLRIDPSDDRPKIYLGRLPRSSDVTWSGCRMLLANVLHYAIVRTNLREWRPYHENGGGHRSRGAGARNGSANKRSAI